MKLNETQAKETIKNPVNREKIDSVKKYESQLRVFTMLMDDTELMNECYWNELQQKLKIRSDKKFERICQFFRFPLPVVQITDSILNDYFKMFDGKNRFFDVNAQRDVDVLKQWIQNANLEKWIEKESVDVLTNKPCSIVVVDREQNGTPYLLNIDSKRLIDCRVNDDDEIEYIVFIHSILKDEKGKTETLFSVYDSEQYMVFSKHQDSENINTEKIVKHKLGYCPARFFVSTKTNDQNEFKRRVAFGQSLANLEDWTYFDLFRNYVDHYVPFPVTEAPIKKCANQKCKNGMVGEEEIVDHATNKTRIKWSKCPVCKNKDMGSLIAPGTHIGIKLQGTKDREDGSGKFKMHFPETEKMKYVPEKLDDLELEIRYKTVGLNNLIENESINEMQVKGSFTSMESVMLRNKKELDKLYKWIVKTVGGLYYENVSLHVEANFGTEFYLIDEKDLQKKFENAKKIGLPKSEQVLIYEQLIETKYQGNPMKLQRQQMLLHLDPLPLYSESETIDMFQKKVINYKTLNFKINFYKFVKRFEDENTVLTEFGINLPMAERIKIILETLTTFNDENIESKQPESGVESTEED